MRWRAIIARVLVRVSALLLLGIITTVLVAWALALWLPPQPTHWRVNVIGSPAEGFIGIHEIRRPGMLRRSWRPEAFAPAPGWFRELAHQARVVPARVARQDRRWGRLPDALEHRRDDPALLSGMEDARGWPCLALWCGLDEGGISGATAADPVWGGLAMSSPPVNAGRYRALPFQPIPAGFLLNSAFYAAGWAGAFTIGWGARRQWRRWRGCCPRCAYDLRGSVEAACSECGWRRSGATKPRS